MKEDKDSEYKHILSSLNILRNVTRIIKIAPFIYTLIYIVFLAMQILGWESIMPLMESMCYVSPIVIITLFILSHSLKLCFFYRLQCLLSAAPQIFVLIDEYLYEFGTLSVSLATVFMGTVFLLSMINVYRALKENNYDAKIVSQIHDELIIKVNDDEKDKVKALVQDIMEHSVDLNVSLKVDGGYAKNWFLAK